MDIDKAALTSKKVVVYACGDKQLGAQPKEFASVKQMLSSYNSQNINLSLHIMGNVNGK